MYGAGDLLETGTLPGTSSSDEELWEEWRDALDALDDARNELMRALNDPGARS